MSITPEEAMILRAGRLWAKARGIGEGRASQLLTGHAYLFARLESGKSTTLKTFDRMRAFLCDPVNWPEGVIPQEVAVCFMAPADTAAETSARDGIGAALTTPPAIVPEAGRSLTLPEAGLALTTRGAERRFA